MCIHSLKTPVTIPKALKIACVLLTPNSIKDVLFTGEESATNIMISETRLKQLLTKSFLRYSFASLGQYIKVDLDPTNPAVSPSSIARPVILRVISVQNDRAEENEGPFML